jgi:hypothetical protein
MMVYREQMLEPASAMPEEMAQQMAMIEEKRDPLGEEMYRQIKQGMEESARTGKATAENARSLPQPTAAEQAILDEYRAELTPSWSPMTSTKTSITATMSSTRKTNNRAPSNAWYVLLAFPGSGISAVHLPTAA